MVYDTCLLLLLFPENLLFPAQERLFLSILELQILHQLDIPSMENADTVVVITINYAE
jgi:hypothetical protein